MPFHAGRHRPLGTGRDAGRDLLQRRAALARRARGAVPPPARPAGARRHAGGANADDARIAAAPSAIRGGGERPMGGGAGRDRLRPADPAGRSLLGPAPPALPDPGYLGDDLPARAARRERGGRVGQRQQPASVPRRASAGNARSLSRGVCRGSATGLPAAPGRAPRCCRSDGCSSWRRAEAFASQDAIRRPRAPRRTPRRGGRVPTSARPC